MKDFLIGRAKSLKFAVKGMFILMRTEHAIISQLIIFLFVILLGFYFKITKIEWALQFLCFGLILTAESLNTAIEKICDFIHPDFHTKIGLIKDISAGAVSFAVTFSIIVTIIIYYPYLIQ
ncbi:diacylglycerol kinase family protein [Weeksellaceae bacterium TAE3-ERU29]|nr:diacylglycerol kinase family protein [Weeksellaceae bacterium TAE3-ERU29]